MAALRGGRRHGRARRALSLPVVGGNVSLYNESRGRDIDPTPIVAVVGMVDDPDNTLPGVCLVDGTRLVVLGPEPDTLSGSQWAWWLGHRSGTPPALDLDGHRATCELVWAWCRRAGAGAHDAADGGLGLALAEMAVRSGWASLPAPPAPTATRWLFGESPAASFSGRPGGPGRGPAPQSSPARTPLSSATLAATALPSRGCSTSRWPMAWRVEATSPELLGHGTTQADQPPNLRRKALL